ncbi:MAG: UDP-N-acetylmuramate dehydrogenase [Lachnospiraceae bacterium]|nr:UDP-N-acetylmuramate dehydrogenase [Lachnospiraceae bacterium]
MRQDEESRLKENTIEAIRKMIPEDRISLNEKMAGHTTFRVGGPADCFITVNDIEELSGCLSVIRDQKEEYFLIGNGSNLLVGDKGYRGIVLKLSGEFEDIEAEGTYIEAGAGALLSKTAMKAYEASLSGLEFASGIPGSIGGAIVMNAGAYGGEMKDVVREVTLFDPVSHSVVKKKADEMAFGYRDSIIKHSELIVLKACFELKKDDRDKIKALMDDLTERRITKQPLNYPSAGSTFKRPEGYFAGKLIDDSGLRGYRVGGAMISDKHCGFVINKSEATALDIITLIKDVQTAVMDKQGVAIEPEVLMIGEF